MKSLFTICALLLIFNTHAQWNPNTSVNLEVSGLETADLQTATTADGKTWIAFYHYNGGNYDMRAQLLDAQGNKLLGSDGALVCNQPSGTATFVFNVCLDASGNLIIGFQYEVAGTLNAVVSKINTDGSLPWGPNGVVLGAGLAPYPTVLTTGETVVAWNNDSPATLYVQKLDAAGAIVWGAPISILVGASNTTRGQIAANLNGYFTVVFQRRSFGISTTLFAQRYNNSGTPQWASPLQLTSLTTSGARYYSVLADADTVYAGYYASDVSRFYAYVQRINPGGTAPWGSNGSPFSTYSSGADPYQQTINIGYIPGSPHLWAVCTYSNTSQSQYGVYAQKFNVATGAVMLNPLGKEVYPISSNMDTQTGDLGLFSPEGPVFISYDANYKIKLTVLDANGDLQPWVGFPYEMSSTTATLAVPKGRFAFNYNPISGNAVAVWYENRGSFYKPYAQNRNLFIVPVQLVNFNAVKNSKQVNLYWNTATEIDNNGFSIERSPDGIHFNTIGFVNSIAVGGNSSVNLDYAFTDKHPLSSRNYYRLQQLNTDGKSNTSKVVLVRYDKQGDFYIDNIYPNPVADQLHISVTAYDNAQGTLTMSDMNGKKVFTKQIGITKGSNSFYINVSSLAKGSYTLQLVNGNYRLSEKWVKE